MKSMGMGGVGDMSAVSKPVLPWQVKDEAAAIHEDVMDRLTMVGMRCTMGRLADVTCLKQCDLGWPVSQQNTAAIAFELVGGLCHSYLHGLH